MKIPVKNPGNFRQPGPGARFLANFVPGPGLNRDPGRALAEPRWALGEIFEK